MRCAYITLHAERPGHRVGQLDVTSMEQRGYYQSWHTKKPNVAGLLVTHDEAFYLVPRSARSALPNHYTELHDSVEASDSRRRDEWHVFSDQIVSKSNVVLRYGPFDLTGTILNVLSLTSL